MSYPRPLGPDDLDRDDELLDLLGRGAVPAGGDQVGLMLAAWRSDLAEAELPQPLRTAVPEPDETAPAPVWPTVPAGPTGPTPTGPRAPRRAGGPEPGGPSRRSSRRFRLAVAVVAAVVLLGGGVAIAAANATPNSPLWPVAQLLFPQRADRLAAEDALAQARTAIREGRVADAQQLVAQAQTLVAQVDDPVERSRLGAELEQVRQLLSAAGVISPGSGTAANPQPSGGPNPSATPGSLLPSQLSSPGLPSVLPTGIVPTQILPTSILPSLPILGG